jgi:hypothetical protein
LTTDSGDGSEADIGPAANDKLLMVVVDDMWFTLGKKSDHFSPDIPIIGTESNETLALAFARDRTLDL